MINPKKTEATLGPVKGAHPSERKPLTLYTLNPDPRDLTKTNPHSTWQPHCPRDTHTISQKETPSSTLRETQSKKKGPSNPTVTKDTLP